MTEREEFPLGQAPAGSRVKPELFQSVSVGEPQGRALLLCR